MRVHELVADHDRILGRMRQAIDEVHVTIESSRDLVEQSRRTIRRARNTTDRVPRAAMVHDRGTRPRRSPWFSAH